MCGVCRPLAATCAPPCARVHVGCAGHLLSCQSWHAPRVHTCTRGTCSCLDCVHAGLEEGVLFSLGFPYSSVKKPGLSDSSDRFDTSVEAAQGDEAPPSPHSPYKFRVMNTVGTLLRASTCRGKSSCKGSDRLKFRSGMGLSRLVRELVPMTMLTVRAPKGQLTNGPLQACARACAHGDAHPIYAHPLIVGLVGAVTPFQMR